MATEAKKDKAEAGHRLYRLDVGQFLSMIEVGVFPNGSRVELLGGVLFALRAKTDPDDYAVVVVGEQLRRILAGDRLVREEKALGLGRYSRPLPDLAVVRGPRTPYSRRAPAADETALIVEVAGTSYDLDRGLKWRIYASAGIPTYWIVNLATRQIEVYRDPAGRGKSAGYRESATYGPGAEVPVVVDGREAGRVAVGEVLP